MGSKVRRLLHFTPCGGSVRHRHLALPSLRSSAPSVIQGKNKGKNQGNTRTKISINEVVFVATKRHCISVRLSPEELEKIDSARGKIPRGTWCRKALLGKPIAVVPAVNRDINSLCGRWAGILNQMARGINSGVQPDVEQAREALKKFRAVLMGIEDDESENC